ncbi:MAG: hypothetical protein LBH31_01800, partial [Burkholderiaceae bacterium]|jgi:hypothetical protein|nr:hypothetical protein [Burkholderiaceae bacterium]
VIAVPSVPEETSSAAPAGRHRGAATHGKHTKKRATVHGKHAGKHGKVKGKTGVKSGAKTSHSAAQQPKRAPKQ